MITIYSDKTHKSYNSIEEANAAEQAYEAEQTRLHEEAEAKRKAKDVRAEEVNKAYENYSKLLKQYYEDYHCYPSGKALSSLLFWL